MRWRICRPIWSTTRSRRGRTRRWRRRKTPRATSQARSRISRRPWIWIHRTRRPGTSYSSSRDCSRHLFVATAGAGPEVAGRTVLIVFVADELHQVTRPCLPVRAEQPRGELQVNGVRQRSWVFERNLVDDRAVIRSRVPLDGVQLLGVRGPTTVEPELVVEADRVDHERVTFP